MEQEVHDKQNKEWIKQELNPILRGNCFAPSTEIIDQIGGTALLSADTDKIKEYVFESAKLPEIRGASMILDYLNQGWPSDNYPNDSQLPSNLREIFLHHGLPTRRSKDDKQDDCIVYAGGGSLLALVPLDLADAIKADIEKIYPDETSAATISCVWQPIAVSDGEGIKFSELMARQSLLLRRAKEEKESLPFFEAIPYSRRCESCQIRPSVGQVPPDGRWLCLPCNKKSFRSRKQGGKKEWAKEFAEELSESNDEWYLNGRTKEYVVKNVEIASEIEKIAYASKDKKSIGFIYADGNDIGKFLDNSKNFSEYKKKSEILHKAVRDSVYKALRFHLKVTQIEVEEIHPFEIVTIGGDDAIIIVPGDRAIDISICIGRTFESYLSEFEEFRGQKVTLSLGLVVADYNNPVYFLLALAEDLLKNAKKKNRECREGAIDFLVIKSQTALSTDLSNLRAHYPWTIESYGEKAILTSRPYTWSKMNELRRTVQEIHKDLPRTQLQALCRSLRKGRRASTMFYRYQWARADNQRKDLLSKIERKWGVESINSPWIKQNPKDGHDCFSTIWEDIRELNDLMPSSNDEIARQELMQQKGHSIGGEQVHES